VDPLDGYQGISGSQFRKIKNIVDEYPELCDPKLDQLVWSIEEDMRIEAHNYNYSHDSYDENRKVYYYVRYAFNKTRKRIGLPSDILYVYPILYKLRYSETYSNMQYKFRRFKRKFIQKRKERK